MSDKTTIQILERNVNQLEQQLRDAWTRNSELLSVKQALDEIVIAHHDDDIGAIGDIIANYLGS